MFLVSVGGTIHNASLSVDVVKPVSFLEELSMVLDYFNILLESEFALRVFFYQLAILPYPTKIVFSPFFVSI